MHTSIIQILKLNEARSGTKDGRAWEMQDAECLLLNANGEVEQVGVLMIPKALKEKVKVGTFTGTFALRANMASRKIEAVLTDIVLLPSKTAAVTPKV